MKSKPKNYYLEEIIISSDVYHSGTIKFIANILITKRINELRAKKNLVFEETTINNISLNEDSLSSIITNNFKDDDESQRDCFELCGEPDFQGESNEYHFLIFFNKGYIKKVNGLKKYVYDILKNQDFVDYINFSIKDFNALRNKPIEFDVFTGKLNECNTIAHNDFGLPTEFEYIVFNLLSLKYDFKHLFQNFDKIIQDGLNPNNYYSVILKNKLNYDKPVTNYKIITEINKKLSSDDFNNIQIQVEYFQNKYPITRTNNIKYDFDKYYKLKQLDKNKNLSDGEKADIIFKINTDDEKLPTPEEDTKMKNIIRTMRKRNKTYFK